MQFITVIQLGTFGYVFEDVIIPGPGLVKTLSDTDVQDLVAIDAGPG